MPSWQDAPIVGQPAASWRDAPLLSEGAQEAALERGLGDVLYENIIGRGEVDTPGERFGATVQDMGKAALAGISRGITGTADLLQMGTPAGMAQTVLEKTGVVPERPGFRETAEQLTGGATEFRGETVPGQFAGTVGEFIPGAVAGPGGVGSNLLRYGVTSGVASEAAGQLTEGTQYEPIARFVAAIAAPTLLAKNPKLFTDAIRGADPERVRLANVLMRLGVKPTAGQATGSQLLQRAEGTVAPLAQQIDDFTAAAMRTTGSKAKRATTQALASAEKRIVGQMDDVLKGTSVATTADDANSALRIATDYVERVPQGSLVPRIRGIANEIADVATDPKAGPIALSQLRKWRTDIGKYSVSPDGATREAAHGLRTILDAMTDRALVSAGKAAAVSQLRTSRVQYRNLLAIKDAASKAGEAAAVGVITPARLRSAVVRTQGKSQYVTGRGTELSDLARAGEAVLSPAATVAPGAERAIAGLPQAGLAGAGFVAGGVPGAVAGLAAPAAGRAAVRSPAAQSLIADPVSALRRAATQAPGTMLAVEEDTQ